MKRFWAKKNSNRWYFKIKEILEDEIPEGMGLRKYQIEKVMEYVDETVDKVNLEDEEIDLFYRLWKCSENLEEEALVIAWLLYR